MKESISNFPYDRPFVNILLQGGPLWFLTVLVASSAVLLLVIRRFLLTAPTSAFFTIADIFFLLILLSCPLLHALISIPTGIVARDIPGLDTSWVLPMHLQETVLLSGCTLIGIVLILICCFIQLGIRKIRKT